MSSTSEPTVDEILDDLNPRETYDDLVWSAVTGAVAVLLTKIVSVLVLGRAFGAELELDFWLGVVPHLQFATESSTFTWIVTLSTLAMAVVALAIAALTFVGRLDQSRQRVMGRGVASIIVLQTLGLEAYRHRVQDATLRWGLAWLVIVAGVAGIALVAVSLWKDHDAESPLEKETHS